MRLSQNDRVQAIIRHSQYRKDYDNIQKLKAKAPEVEIGTPFRHRLYSLGTPTYYDPINKVMLEEDKIAKKWGLPFLINPKREAPDLTASPVFVISNKTFEIRPRTTPPNDYCQALTPIKGNKKISLKKLCKFLMKPENIIAQLEKGRYLTLKLDLWANKKELLKGVERQIKLFFRYANRPKGRIRKSIDHWKICDMCHDEKKPLLKIAKEILKFQKNPSYDLQAKAKYQRVVSAYNKAVEMIEAVTPTT